jgi:hypothetical protein
MYRRKPRAFKYLGRREMPLAARIKVCFLLFEPSWKWLSLLLDATVIEGLTSYIVQDSFVLYELQKFDPD